MISRTKLLLVSWFQTKLSWLAVSASVAIVFSIGCDQGKSSVPPGAPAGLADVDNSNGEDSSSAGGAEEEVSVLGFAYHYYHDSFRKGPDTIADLGKGNLKPEKLQELHGDEYEVNPGLEFRELGDKMSTTWLVRRKDASSKGGYVFMADGTVKKMSADEVKQLE